jgi:(p)ppGpp synthase/HD superfamily hydrolase
MYGDTVLPGGDMPPTLPQYSDVVQRALVFAASRHKEPRKGSDIPYITHPAHVAILLARYGFEEPVLAAAILHDVLEDTETRSEELRQKFGQEITGLVEQLSEPQFEDRPRTETWDQRKQAKLRMLEKASRGALAIAAADRVHNTANILEDLRECGPSVWKRFNSSPEKILDFGRKVLDILQRRFPHPLTEEYGELLEKLEKVSRP